MMSEVYLNGEFVPTEAARISIDDGAFLHGAGLFETMRAENGRIFRLESHMSRLTRSANRLFAPIQRSALPEPGTFESLLDRNALRRARVRLTVSYGSTFSRGAPDAPSVTVCATARELTAYPPETYQNGVSVLISRVRTLIDDPLAGHKTTSYLPRLLALRAAHAARCHEALAFNTRNELAEGTMTNVFTVRDGRIRTPAVDTPVLPGVARSTVIETAADLGLELDDRTPLTVDDLLDADEVFLTNVIIGVLPVTRVEKKDIGTGRPGPVTGRLSEAFLAAVHRECGGEPLE